MKIGQLTPPPMNNLIAGLLIYGAGFVVSVVLAWPDVVRYWDMIPKGFQIAMSIPPFGPAIFMSLVFIGSVWAGNLLPVGVLFAGGLAGGAIVLIGMPPQRSSELR